MFEPVLGECPECGDRLGTLETRPRAEYIRRRKGCGCGYRITTVEIPADRTHMRRLRDQFATREVKYR
jgi:hypothetical protein